MLNKFILQLHSSSVINSMLHLEFVRSDEASDLKMVQSPSLSQARSAPHPLELCVHTEWAFLSRHWGRGIS